MKNFNRNKSVFILTLLLALPFLDSAPLGGVAFESSSFTSNTENEGGEQVLRQLVQSGDGDYTGGGNFGAIRSSVGSSSVHSNTYNGDKVINTVLNINDSNTAALLNNFNVSKDEILRRISALQPATVTTSSAEQHNENDANASASEDAEQRDMFIDAFKKRIESVVERNASRNLPDPNAAIHDMAFYPVCSKNNQTSWLEDNTAKLYFSSSIFDKLIPNTFLHRAVLRLRQKSPEPMDGDRSEHDTQTVGCTDLDDIIHVKVSILVKRPIRGGNNRIGSNANSGNNRRENKFKKLVCHSFTTKRVNSDWVEIDVRQVIKHWEKIYRSNSSHNKGAISDPMVAIDVEDEFQTPLKAGLFFEPTDCQASPAIPWSLYGENVRDLFGTQILPHNPRLDIKWSRLHRPHHHYYRRNHRHRNINRVENLRLLKESPLMPADYQYQATDQGNFNIVADGTHVRNHRKRHVQNKYKRDSAHFAVPTVAAAALSATATATETATATTASTAGNQLQQLKFNKSLQAQPVEYQQRERRSLNHRNPSNSRRKSETMAAIK